MVAKQSVRYVAKQPFVYAGKRSFSPDRTAKDGTHGYTTDEIKGLPKKVVTAMFNKITVAGESVQEVEEATAAPGAKRSVSKP